EVVVGGLVGDVHTGCSARVGVDGRELPVVELDVGVAAADGRVEGLLDLQGVSDLGRDGRKIRKLGLGVVGCVFGGVLGGCVLTFLRPLLVVFRGGLRTFYIVLGGVLLVLGVLAHCRFPCVLGGDLP